MSDTIDQIHEDHRNYSILLSLLNTDVEHLQQGVHTDFIRLYDIMNYMTNYPDVKHHPSEEIIFDHLLEKHPELSEEIEALVNEHRQLAETGSALKEKLQYVTSGAIVPKDDILKATMAYSELLISHLNFEEGKLLPMVEKQFTEDDWKKIHAQIESTEDPLFGSVVDEQFSDLFKRIALQKQN